MTLDPTRAYVIETRSESRGSTGTHSGPNATGHWRLVSAEILPQPAQRNNNDVDVLYVWEPILLDGQQQAEWNKSRTGSDHINNLSLDDRTKATLETAGVTSITVLKALSDEEFKRLRLSGPLSFRDLKSALGR